VCRLKKSLYKLKQSLKVWFGQFAFVVQDFCLSRFQKDHFVFWRQHQGKMLLLVVYVDDLIITDDDVQEIVDLFRQKTLYFCGTFYALKILDP